MIRLTKVYDEKLLKVGMNVASLIRKNSHLSIAVIGAAGMRGSCGGLQLCSSSASFGKMRVWVNILCEYYAFTGLHPSFPNPGVSEEHPSI
jgi:hypothetical protein